MSIQSPPHPQAPRRGEITGRHVLIMMLAFFGVVIAANVVFITTALRTFPGEDVRRSYVQGLRYNDTLQDRQTQAALGWRAAASLTRSGPGAVLEVHLVDAAGADLTGVALEGALRRPVDARADVSLVFTPLGEGRYAAQIETLAPGQWRLRARAVRGPDHFDVEATLQ